MAIQYLSDARWVYASVSFSGAETDARLKLRQAFGFRYRGGRGELEERITPDIKGEFTVKRERRRLESGEPETSICELKDAAGELDYPSFGSYGQIVRFWNPELMGLL